MLDLLHGVAKEAGWLGPAIIGLSLAFLAIYRVAKTPRSIPPVTLGNRDDAKTSKTVSSEIIPLEGFDWRAEEPLKLRPFKTTYNLTMAVEKSSVSDMIVMDKNYLDRITLRKEIMRAHPEVAIAASPSATPAIKEFYEWLVATLLPRRFPTMFQICPAEKNKPACILNHADGERYPLRAPDSSIDALKVIGAIIEDDILFLLPSADGDGYVMDAFVTCFPNGFNMKSKFNMKVRDIHIPVPKYKEKMEKSMERYFARMEVGKFIKRANWSITKTPLFTIDGNHLYDGEEVPEFELELDKLNMRCERQVLHRLPQTKALLFSVKTYMYPLTSLKEEGVGPDLIDAIDGLFKGNVPEMGFYKRAVEWKEPVKAYLRS